MAPQDDIITQVRRAVEDGRITPEDGVTEIAFRLNANAPESLKMGWPLITSIEVAAENLDVVVAKEDILSRFRYEHENHTGAVLVIEETGGVVRVMPWPDGPAISVQRRENPDEDRYYRLDQRHGGVNWSSIGTVHPARAIQFAKALKIAADEAAQEA
jgi:hypothetical protein